MGNRIGLYLPKNDDKKMKKSRSKASGEAPAIEKKTDAGDSDKSQSGDSVAGESRASLEEARREQFKGLDAAIYKLSTLGLAFTLAFAQKIGSDKKVGYPVLLVVSWAMYFVAIVLPLINYRLSIVAIDAKLDDADDVDLKTRRVRIVNLASLSSLAIALVLTIIYAALRVC